MWVLAGDDAPTLGALVMGVLAFIVRVLSAEAPPTGFPQWALLLAVVGLHLIALEAVGECVELAFASFPLTQD